jgi:hypothetical protein
MTRKSLQLFVFLAVLACTPIARAAYDPNKPFEPALASLLQARDYDGALKRTRALLEDSPDDWQLRSLVPSLYARLGDDANFEREIEALVALRDRSTDMNIRRLKGIPIQAVKGGDRTAMIHRCLEPPQKPLQPLYVAFVTKDGATQPDTLVMLNRTGRELYQALGLKGADWALDAYSAAGHATIGFVEKQPRYGEFKASLERWLATPSAVSSSSSNDGRPPAMRGCA